MGKFRDSNTPVTTVSIRDFAGMITNADEFDLPENAAVEQKNVTCITPGALTNRAGLRRVLFDD